MLRPTQVLALVVLLAAAALPAAAAGAPKRADLKLTGLGVTPGVAAPGAQVRVGEAVRNAGSRKARPSRVAYLLSKDGRKGKGDVRLGTRSVKQLPRGKRSKGARRLTIPATVAPGAWFLLACADAEGVVKERSERDNCAAGRLTVTAPAGSGGAVGGGSAPALPAPAGVPAAPGGGGPAPTFDGTFLRTPNPLDVDPVPDTARAVTETFSAWSDRTMTTTGADGTQYALTIPAGALFSDEEITMTPIASIGGLPLSQGLMGAVELEPHGLVLNKAATLTIDPPGADPAVGAQSAFMAHDETGSDFHLFPVGKEQTATLRLLHFSTAGVGLGTAADRNAVNDRPGARPLAQLEQALAETTRQDRSGLDPDLSTLEAPLLAYYDHAVRPQLLAAETSEALAPNAISGAMTWARQLALLSMNKGEKYDAKYNDMLQRLIRVLNNAVKETYAKCVKDHDLAAGARMVGWLRQAALLSIETDMGFDEFVKCMRFEVDFDSTITTDGGFDGDTQDQSWNGSWHVKAENILMEIGSGQVDSGPIKNAGSSYTHTTTHAPSSSCTLVSTTTLTSMEDGVMAVGLVLDINPRETPPSGVLPSRRHKLRLHVTTAPKEHYRSQNSGCSTGSSTSWNTRWDDIFGGFRDNSSVLLVDIDPDEQVGDLVTDRRIVSSETGWDTTEEETTDVQLWHKPDTTP